MKQAKLAVEIFFILCFTLVLVNFRLVDYGLAQLTGQLKIILNSRPVSEVQADPDVPDAVKRKLLFVQEVERFGVDSLGLKPTKNYRTFFDQEGKPLLWVVTASEPFKLKAFTWRFPLLGELSYKGFFVEEKAKKESRMLEEQGYDIDSYDVSAWSTLGWMRDPILSGMLKRDEGRLAELILHELTHATLYVKGDVDFNENLASFIGEQGALRYLSSVFGDSSDQWLNYRRRLDDDFKFTSHLFIGASYLDSLYNSNFQFLEVDMKNKVKLDALKMIIASLDTVSFAVPSRFEISKERAWNNARFLSYLRYDAQKDEMKREMDSLASGDIRQYLELMKAKYPN